MIILSFSRGALLFCGMFLICFFVSPYCRNAKINKLIISSVFIGAIILLFYINKLSVFLKDKVFRLAVGDAGRSDLWIDTLSKVDFGVKEILLGIGFSSLNNIGTSYVHNIYLELFLVGGIIKLSIYFILFICAFKRICDLKAKNRLLFHFCFSVLAGYLFFGWFESVIVFELGLISSLFTIMIFFLPGINYESRIRAGEI
jgi:O-antigen ligase